MKSNAPVKIAGGPFESISLTSAPAKTGAIAITSGAAATSKPDLHGKIHVPHAGIWQMRITTPENFIHKWRNSTLKERSAAQEHFIDLCRLLGEKTPVEADPQGKWYSFEKGAKKTGGGDGWADVWKRGCFAWEYKGKQKDLDAALKQLQQYALALENPPLLIVSDMDTLTLPRLKPWDSWDLAISNSCFVEVAQGMAWLSPVRFPNVGSLTRCVPQPVTPPGLTPSRQALRSGCPSVDPVRVRRSLRLEGANCKHWLQRSAPIPPLKLWVCGAKISIIVHTNFTNSVHEVHTITLQDLADQRPQNAGRSCSSHLRLGAEHQR